MTNDEIEEAQRRYLADQILTATPVQRLLMLFEQLLSDLQAADAAFDSGAIEPIHLHLVHAQEIVLALHDGVATQDWEVGERLRDLYRFVHRRLVWCNVKKDRSLLPACSEILTRIYEANRKAANAHEAVVVA
ncbi:MAG: flagellar protein FliS [Actinomycetota bacterium]|nr:flagellar protein FliS [Actinomycetota bacterium]